ncbi:MAG: UMP kinase [Lentimicrobiaceae bacterium]|jgi:uridylate kinase|nr:UMP kinase [Lentimicrobiaceae bacterium]MBT3454735.1 UMP kinase [Lentimicrobiaceae bacterium]MBT3819661.1 UMP kinase [Lentimicrobiaceae bacterium]MBT4061261.1 UMP kinase [Lentimicrobiaceae bacterium]MBT4191420.1 UMP kinase [Lentimicrobiaceae bacterium]
MYNRVLLKLSGESLMGSQSHGINPDVLLSYCEDIKAIVDKGVQVAIVIGGGNIFRGIQGVANGMDRVQGDYMGMLATVINSMGLQSELEKQGLKAKLLSGLFIDPIAESMSAGKAKKYLNDGYVVIIAGGTGNPFFTTDTASALRAVEIGADVLLKGTRVDGVYSADPERDPNAKKYDAISFAEAYEKNLMIMDMTAFTLCKENELPIVVFDMNTKGNLLKVVDEKGIGTIVK